MALQKDILSILSVITKAPPACAECVAFCQEGHISCNCRGDFHPETCECSSIYKESEE